MSTNSTITLEVNPKDMGKVKKMNKKNIFTTKELEIVDLSKVKPIKVEKAYITIYCHWDGYIEGVGLDLLRWYNDYKKVLSLILGGDIVNFPYYLDEQHKSVLTYFIDKHKNRDGWNDVKPMQFDSIREMLTNQSQQYNYLYQNGQWYVQSATEYGCGKFVPLKDLIMNRKKFEKIRELIP